MTVESNNKTYILDEEPIRYLNQALHLHLFDLKLNRPFYSQRFLMYKDEIHSISFIHKASDCRIIKNIM